MAEGEQCSEGGGSESRSEGQGELDVTSSLLPPCWMSSFPERPGRNLIAFLSKQNPETAVTWEPHLVVERKAWDIPGQGLTGGEEGPAVGHKTEPAHTVIQTPIENLVVMV